MRPTIKLLGNKLVERIVSEARALLQTKGVNLNHDGLLARFGDNGCRIDREKKWVWFTDDIIDRSLASAPGQIKLWNVAGDDHFDLSGNNVHFTPGSAGIKILDHKTNHMRPATLDDMLLYDRIVGQLSHISYPSTAVVPSDVPNEIGDSIRLYGLLYATGRPVVTGAFTIAGFDVMRDLHLAVRGTEEALSEKPFTIFSCCPTSPLKWSDVTADNTMKCAELGIPVEFISMPLPGLVAPITLVGSLIQHTVETLSGIIISQTSRPGAPVLYGGSPGSFDMRTMAASIAALEAQMMDCAYAQIGKHLGLPTQAYIGLSDSKSLDAQAGHETGTGIYLGALAGINSLSGPGMLYYESCQSLEKLVLDNEICGMAQRLVAGIEPREDFPAEGLFDELLSKHELLTADHTLKHYKEEHFVPGPSIDRTQVSDDQADYPTLRKRAHAQIERLASDYTPSDALSPDQRRELDKVMNAAAKGSDITDRIKKALS
jgi:trimethylamine--corrinoid protein Co-methyltransferase